MAEPAHEIATPLGPVRLRAETPQDAAFRYDLFCRSRLPEWDMVVLAPEVREQIMRHQFQAQTMSYLAQFAGAAFDIIELDGAPAGRIVVDRPGDELHLVDMAVVPELRGRGLGAAILHALMDEAAGAGLPVRLKVASSNDPSMRLYVRLGFAVIAEDPMYLEMEWRATG